MYYIQTTIIRPIIHILLVEFEKKSKLLTKLWNQDVDREENLKVSKDEIVACSEDWCQTGHTYVVN